MKLPWDRKYIKISFHVVVTVFFLCATILIMMRLPQVINELGTIFKGFISVAAPLITAIVIAFLLDPIVDMFEDRIGFFFKIKAKRKNRLKGAVLTYITLFLFIALAVVLAIKKLGATDINQVAYLANTYIQELSDRILSFQKALSHMGVLGTLNNIINSAIISITGVVKNAVLSVAEGITSLGGAALNIGIGLVVAFYFLTEKERMILKLKKISWVLFSHDTHMKICTFFRNLSLVFSGYVTGQVTDAIIMATMIMVSFWAAGIKYAVLIGLISGFSNLIPYIGAIVAFVLSVTVGFISGTPIKALYAAIIVIILQQIDSMIIVPKIVGRSVKLHPVLVILALSVFGGLFGLWGMVIAVPVTALIKIYFDQMLERMEIKKLEK